MGQGDGALSKVTVVIDPWEYPFNGAVVSTRRFVNALDEKFAFDLLITAKKSEDERLISFKRLSIPGFNRIIDAMKTPLALPNRKQLEAALLGSQILHVQFPFFLGFSAITVARKLDVPIICSFHVQPENLLMNIGLRSPILTNWLYTLFIKAFYNRANLVIAPSEFAANTLQARGLKVPVRILSNGVPENFINLTRHYRPNNGRFKILSVGRLAGEKNQTLILNAIAKSQYRDQIDINIVGHGPLAENLKTLANKLNLSVEVDSVSDDRLLALYATADLFVHAGEIELEGMSVVEAMATGNVVLVADAVQSASPTFVFGKHTLFKPGDAQDLCTKLDYWLSNPKRRALQGEENRDWARHKSHKKSADELGQIYASMMGRNK